MKIPILFSLVLLVGCSTSSRPDSTASDDIPMYKEAYEIYPGVGGNGISKHLIRSHTTAILVRPGSSALELCNRGVDQVWDWIRRLETRFLKFPRIHELETPVAARGFGGMDLVAWEHYLDRLTGQPATTAEIELLIGGKKFYSALTQSIENAKIDINIQTYLFDNDDVARSIADQLRNRSKNVDVRIIYDGFGTYLSHTATAASQPEDTTYIENMPRYLCKNSNIRLRVTPNIWLSGNHIKSFIFDRRTAYIGGMNIGREYQHDWHDMMVRLEGPAVDLLFKNFDKTWRHSGWRGDLAYLQSTVCEPAIHHDTNGVPIRFLYTLPTSAQIYRAQLEAIRRSRSYIYIENCYFSDDRILYELCSAAYRGVDVRVILPAKVNHSIMERSNRIAINTLLKHGARAYLYPKMSHIKAAIYDGWACLGTANFDKLSLQIIREINLATSDPETVNQLLEELFETDFDLSTEITEPLSLERTDHFLELIADEV